MPFSHTPRPHVLKSLKDVRPIPFWMDSPQRPDPLPPLTGTISADLCVIGAGFTGLWTALLAKESDPGLKVVLLEAGETGSGASGRNGGFCDHCLTHTFENGLARWPDELETLVRLGYENLDAIEETVHRYQIDCDFLRSGEMVVATEPYQLERMREAPAEAASYGLELQYFDQEQTRALVNSPTYLGSVYDSNTVMLDPARLTWGLRRASLERGVRLFEGTQAEALEEAGGRVIVRTQKGQVEAERVALATNAFPPLLKRLRHYIVPVYDYALMTEPLTEAQRASIGWEKRMGVGDAGNQFHYYRTSADGRILWGGYDAVYYRNNGFGSHLEVNAESFGRLADHFFQTFPQLEGIRFTHAWGGAIDTCSRFNVFWGQAFGGKLVYALGYTGLGVGASRFGAQVILDLLNGADNERTRLQMVREKPLPFPPEPLRSAVVNLTRWSMDQADRHQGRRNLWLKLLDVTGLGFNS
ncbi:MAG: FAD-dependent oxidoreductase [Anaerolineales bacterium]